MISANSISGREWDEFDGYLFDIDGTLIRCDDAVHYYAFCEALESISGTPMTLEGVTAHGNTDVGILRDAFALHAIGEEVWRERIAELRERMCRFVTEHRDELCPTVLPHVIEVLRHLHMRKAMLGIATGNLEAIGRMKLERAGLLELFDFGMWSDQFEFRDDVVQAGVRELRSRLGVSRSICMVGDTPEDIRAAHNSGVAAIAVATGVYRLDELRRAGPELCVDSLQALKFNAAELRPEQVSTTSAN